MPYNRQQVTPQHRPDVAEPSDHIPTSGGTDECPDCWHHSHWKIECPTCGCPDGITRKRIRDAEHVISHGPGEGRPVTGFA
jgi:hypothetical protein